MPRPINWQASEQSVDRHGKLGMSMVALMGLTIAKTITNSVINIIKEVIVIQCILCAMVLNSTEPINNVKQFIANSKTFY